MKQKLIAGVAGMGLLLGNAAWAFADTTVDVNNTGAESTNKAYVTQVCNDKVVQTNVSRVSNQVSIYSNTGKNTANKNTGDGSVNTGGVYVGVGVLNGGNSNTAESNGCCECAQGDTDVTVADTGFDSYNKVSVLQLNSSSAYQKNYSSKLTSVWVKSQTGKNRANKNTGNGSVETEAVEVGVEVINEGDSNDLL